MVKEPEEGVNPAYLKWLCTRERLVCLLHLKHFKSLASWGVHEQAIQCGGRTEGFSASSPFESVSFMLG